MNTNNLSFNNENLKLKRRNKKKKKEVIIKELKVNMKMNCPLGQKYLQ